MTLELNPPDPSPQLSRRALLQLMGAGAIGSTLGYSRFKKPDPTVYGKDDLILPTKLTDRKRVAVVGGGLAGLASAYELSKRGFEVTLLERSPQLGGKIASWTVDVNGHSMQMEHGFHGFFPQYYNLWSIVDELTAQANFVSLPTYAVVYKDHYKPEVFKPSSAAFPWNIVDLTFSSPNSLGWGLNLTKPTHWQVFKEIAGFAPQNNYERLDNLSVTEWVGKEFPQGLYDLYFLPFAKSSLNSPDLLSAAEMMQFFHFYFFGNPEGLAFKGTRQDMGRSLVNPIADQVVENQGSIVTEAMITAIDWKDGEIAGLRYRQGGGGQSAPFWVDRNPLTSTAEVEYFGTGDNVYTLLPSGVKAISLTCTHQGCTVAPKDDGFLCPCHGAAFQNDGELKHGPAKRNLETYTVLKRDGDRLQLVAVNADAIVEETITADYYVFAADVVGMRNLFNLCEGDVCQPIQQAATTLAIADPFAACRMWFDRTFEWEHSDFTSLSGYRLTDSISLYHRIQDDYRDWADEHGGSVVELHAYCYKEAEFPDQTALLAAFEAELYEIVPELKGATMMHRELVNQKNFSGFPPNSHEKRPSTTTEVKNLIFAGDWVKMPFPCGLMERAVSSGLLAANAVCQREGLQRRPLLTVNPSGVLSGLTG
jgi:carotenoid phi-ring synthase / carotenoid chi-ring synthase